MIRTAWHETLIIVAAVSAHKPRVTVVSSLANAVHAAALCLATLYHSINSDNTLLLSSKYFERFGITVVLVVVDLK